jgi:hypothetical protein
MKNKTTGYLLFTCGVLLLSTLACASPIDMGELKIDEPVTFEPRDEVDYTWKASVNPGEEYHLLVENEEYGQEGYYGFMDVYDEGMYSGEDGSNLVATGDHFIPSLSFIGPEDGTVTIRLYMINWIETERLRICSN